MVEFKVEGHPQPEGSHTAHIIGGRAVVHHVRSDRLTAWRESVADAFRRSGANYLHDEPIRISIEFHLLRPKSVSVRKRPYMTVKPDIDKLCRSTIDGLSMGTAFDDDSQIVELHASKIYSDWEGAVIDIERFE
jgi:Holliday junction resolvase RusA-like endonuclease